MSTEIALEGKETTGLENDGLWIQTLTQIPETNFVIFIGNDKPVTELEKWLEDTARKEEFHYPSIPEIEDYIISNLHVTHRQAQAFRETLGFSEEFKW